MAAEARTTPNYWQKETGNFQPFRVAGNPFDAILRKHLPVDPRLSCVEVGAYPGANLLYLARTFGYQPFAIEYRDDADDIGRLFEFNGFKKPEIFQEDFLRFDRRRFDVVASFGFVEHFNDPQAVIRKQLDLVNPGGHLVLSVPHFWGMQGLFRKLTFSREALAELFATHNMGIMHLSAIKAALHEPGLETLFLGHTMNGTFWVPADSPKVREDRLWLARALNYFDRSIGSKLPSCFLISPMILAICKFR